MKEPKNVWIPTERELNQWVALQAVTVCNGGRKLIKVNPETNTFQFKNIKYVRDYYQFNNESHTIELTYKELNAKES